MSLLDLLFPPVCLGCGQMGKYLCPDCLEATRGGSTNYLSQGSLTKHIWIFSYSGVVRKAIIALKYKFASQVAKELARVCASELARKGILFSGCVLVPVPLFKTRQNWRGFNQTELVGNHLAEFLGIDYEPRLLMRIGGGKTQVGLTKTNRARNISGKFAVNTTVFVPKNTQIILFDDVWTTGATMVEGASILKNAGFKKIISLTIAG